MSHYSYGVDLFSEYFRYSAIAYAVSDPVVKEINKFNDENI